MEVKPLKSGIYGLYSKAKERIVYVGATSNFIRRKNQHIWMLKHTKHDSNAIQAHANEYGLDDLVFEVLLRCEKELFDINEKNFIEVHKTLRSTGGCNSNPNPGQPFVQKGRTPWNKGTQATEKSKAKTSESTRLAMQDPSIRLKMSLAKMGKPGVNLGRKRNDPAWNRKPVLVFDINGNALGEFPSARHAGVELLADYKKISLVCKGIRRHHKGYVFKFKD